MEFVTEVRLTLAALIYGLESDLKSLIQKRIVPFQNNLRFIASEDKTKVIAERFSKENPGVEIVDNIALAVDYLDFQDTFEVLARNKSFLINDEWLEISRNINRLTTITPIRNRVMHTRPLLAGDLTTISDFVDSLVLSNIWFNTIKTRDLLRGNPEQIFSIKLPTINSDDFSSKIDHNLPLSDFDDTGFIGRKNDVKKLKELLYNNSPVVTVIGNGGIGKSALMLKVAYDIIDDENCPFDIVIWTSAKTTMLTSKGIQEIKNSLENLSGILTEVSNALVTDNDNINNIIEYLEVYKVLLIIDNLETIHNEEVKDFIKKASQHCKIAITSRIGLGELESRHVLEQFNEDEAIQLLKIYSNVKNSKVLLKLDKQILKKIASSLYYSPLSLRWFVNCIENGMTTDEVLNNKGDLLSFCLTNVYEKLNLTSHAILDTLLSARSKKLNTAELMLLTDLEPIIIRKSLNELYSTTLITRDSNQHSEFVYYLSDFSKDYLLKYHPPKSNIVKEVTKKLKSLQISEQNTNDLTNRNYFAISALSISNTNEKVVAKEIGRALRLSRKGFYKDALEIINSAIQIAPEYFELYRISALLKAWSDDLIGASEDYEKALEIEPNNPRILYFYVGFLLDKINDKEEALMHSTKLYEHHKNEPSVVILHSRCLSHNNLLDDAIQIVERLLSSTVNGQDKRKAYSQIIKYHSIQATNYCKGKDFKSAVRSFETARETMEKCIFDGDFDTELVYIMNSVLANYTYLPILNFKEIEQDLLEFISKNVKILGFGSNFNVLKEKFVEVFEINIDDAKITEEFNKNRLIGNVSLNKVNLKANKYFFIRHKNNSYFAHITNFKEFIPDHVWSSIEEGQVIFFNEGYDREGRLMAVDLEFEKS